MKNTSVVLALLLTCTLSFASGNTSPGNPGPTDPVPNAEVLMGLLTDHEGVTFQVESNGCTDKNSFEFSILESHPAQVLLIRKGQDPCRGNLAYGTTVKFTYKEIGLSSPNSFYIINDIRIDSLPIR